MKAVWSIGVWVLGIALFGFAVERIGSGRVRGELARRLRDMMFSLAGLVWLASRTQTGEYAPIWRGAIECKL